LKTSFTAATFKRFISSFLQQNYTQISLEIAEQYILRCFYRAMHFSAKRGIAIACRLSVRPSVCDVGEL